MEEIACDIEGLHVLSCAADGPPVHERGMDATGHAGGDSAETVE
jgi:hypothetical protein